MHSQRNIKLISSCLPVRLSLRPYGTTRVPLDGISRNLIFAKPLEKVQISLKYDNSFIHSVICLTTGPKPPPKRCLHIVRSRASSFK